MGFQHLCKKNIKQLDALLDDYNQKITKTKQRLTTLTKKTDSLRMHLWSLVEQRITISRLLSQKKDETKTNHPLKKRRIR